MAFISFQDATNALTMDLKTQFKVNAPFAQVVALTRTAQKCSKEMKVHMRERFRKLTPYTANQVDYLPATKQTKTAEVFIKYFAGKGNPGSKFLGPEIDGGARAQKRFERDLSSVRAFSGTGFAVPGAAASLNRYGNQSPAEIIKILSILKAFGEQGYSANRTKGWAGKTRIGQIFIVREGGNKPGLKPGVYRRTASGVVPLMKFVRAPSYSVRLPFYELVSQDAAKFFMAEYEAALKAFAPK